MSQVFEILRRKLFWTVDLLKGKRVAAHYSDIKSIMENFYADDSKKRRDDYLANIIHHAIETTPFYSKYKTNNSVAQLPVINKNIIRDNFESFRSTAYSDNQVFAVVTSGSTGTPFKIYHDQNKKNRNSADTIYFAKLAGYHIGQRLIYFKIWNEINKKKWFTAWAQNIVAQDVTNLSATSINALISKIKKDHSLKGFLGYASAYEAICKHLDAVQAQQLHCNVGSAIAMSEGLNDYTKNAMQKYFAVKTVSRYSNVENGILAQQSIHYGNEFYLNMASYYIEVLNFDNDLPVKDGMPGRVVVTDLFNYAMPVIRYDTGDVAMMCSSSGNKYKTPVLLNVEGRRMDMVFNTKGELVSSFTITNNMWKYTEIQQYQFIQLSATAYLFKINSVNDFKRETELIEEFKAYFGHDAVIKVEYVTDVPLLASGKRKKVMNLMQPDSNFQRNQNDAV